MKEVGGLAYGYPVVVWVVVWVKGLLAQLLRSARVPAPVLESMDEDRDSPCCLSFPFRVWGCITSRATQLPKLQQLQSQHLHCALMMWQHLPQGNYSCCNV